MKIQIECNPPAQPLIMLTDNYGETVAVLSIRDYAIGPDGKLTMVADIPPHALDRAVGRAYHEEEDFENSAAHA